MPVAPIVQPNGIQEQTTQPTNESQATIHQLVQSVFTEVLAEFRHWKVKHAEHILRSLTFGERSFPPAPVINNSSNAPPGIVDTNHSLDGDSDTLNLPVTSYSADGTPKSMTVVSLQVIHADVFEPHQPYESCSAISRNVFKGDDDDKMAFIPFADDAAFDHVGHTLCYGSLAWQEDYDPDCEYIANLPYG